MNVDDEFAFGANVWGTPDPEPSQNLTTTVAASSSALSPLPTIPTDDFNDTGGFDDDDFAEPASQNDSFGDDDDFGDFGDEVTLQTAGFSQDSFVQPPAPESQPWQPLRLDPPLSRSELSSQTFEIISPLFSYSLDEITTNDPIREAEGVNQVLVTPGSRELYKVLCSAPPPSKPPNWIRSRIRRQQLITMGIPVNLDEVLAPTASSKPLPTLQISTNRPQSMPPSQSNSQSNSRAGTPNGSNSKRATMPAGGGLGSKPVIDLEKINELVSLDLDSLTILPLTRLEQYLTDMRAQTANMVALLTHLLQQKDGLQQASETYNGLIAELVGEAQKMKTAPGKKQPPSRRGSGAPA